MQARRIGLKAAAATIGACAVLSMTLPAVSAFGQSSSFASTRDGIFSARQVDRGREGFLWNCMDCHEMGEFTGVGAYLEEMQGRTVWDVFEFIWAEMPEDQPAWLEPEEYAEILSYILSVYGSPTGDSDLPTDQSPLEQILIEAPELPGS